MNKVLMKTLPRNRYVKQYGRLMMVALIAIVGGASALAYNHHEAQVKAAETALAAKQAATTKISSNSQPSASSELPRPLISTPPVTKAASTPTPKADNTAQCNSILAAGKAALSSLNAQINQQLAIMKQITANEGTGLPNQINGGGVNGLIGNAEIQQSFNQANNQVTALTNQIDPTRQSYVNQLEGLQCWSQALAMLNYNPSTQ